MSDVDYTGASSRGYNPFPDRETQEAENQAIRNNIKQNFDVLKDIISTLQEQADFYTSVDAVPDNVQTNPEKFMHTMAANRLTRDNLIAIKNRIEVLIEDAKK